jgi:hypothetical protein
MNLKISSLLFLLLLLLSSSTSVLCKVNLRHSATNKEFISHLEEGQFEVVHPFQVRDKNERIGIDTRNYFLNATVHYQHITIVIRSSTLVNGRLKLILNLNDYLFFNNTKFNKLDANGESLIESRIENCFYQGTVNGDATSFVAISTCNGLRGIIAFENGTAYGLWPLDGGDRGRRHPHVLFKTNWKDEYGCGAITQNLGSQFSMLRKKRDVTRQTKYIELAIIGDKKFISEYSFKDEEAVQYILETINIADLIISRDLNIRLSVVYLEIWMDAQRVDIHNDIERTLSGVHDYVTGHIYHISKDATLMFTSSSFASQDAVSSMFSSICTSRAVGLVKAVDSNTVHETSQFVSHAVGHILGIDHDSADCLCPHQQKCIMSRSQSTASSSFLWQFSKCSVARMHSVLQSGHVQCLLNRPFQESRLHQCGNGVVDGDEECDCGPRNECFDPCCDPLTCTLRAHAQCASHQACCHRCELRKPGTLCRESRSTCDVPEYCDGESGDCPADGYLVDGILCGIKGQCWKGNCSDSEQQCKSLWGPDAHAAEEPCYDFNEKGLEYGNCGRNRNGDFNKCESENKKCGTLHCRNGVNLPVDSSLTSFNFQFAYGGKHVQCKAITNTVVGLVADGTHCGSGSICIQGVCLPLVQVSPPVHCPSNNLALQCSGHGDCTTTQKCICYDGWTGIACDTRSNTSRRIIFATTTPGDLTFSSFNGRTIETTTLLMILLIVGVFLLLLLVCLLIFYRRKSSTEYGVPNGNDKIDESYQEDNNRAIKFGSMPSYRDEKRKHKKNKLVYDALHKINEVDERETASLKSRESNSVASVPSHAAENILLHDGREINNGGGILKTSRMQNRFYEPNQEAIYAQSYIPNAGSNSPAQSDFCVIRRHHPASGLDINSGYATDSEIPFNMEMYKRTGSSIRSNLSSRAGSSNMIPTPLKLSSLNQLLTQLPYGKYDDMMDRNEEENCSEPELLIANESLEKRVSGPEPIGDHKPDSSNYQPEPPPASADSGHPASIYDPRQSPHLFDDTFKLNIEPGST